MDELIQMLKEKGVRRFVHFHTDHWEPFISNWDNWGEAASENAKRILDFISETNNHPYFDKMTLFYNHPIRTFSTNTIDKKTNDLLGFEPQNRPFWDRYVHAVRKCAEESAHEFQVHIHHNGITKGDYFKFSHLDWPDDQDAGKRDSERLERFIKETLLDMRKVTGLELETWHFIHGLWALNGSDSRVCNVSNEIEILMRNGCVGDFSMPAGRRMVDSTIRTPHTVIVNNVPKGYDMPEAKIRLIGEELGGDEKRFLIWNQDIPFTHCSLDYLGSESIIKALKDWKETLMIWIKNSPVIGDTAFVKTHAHSMNRNYWSEEVFRIYNSPEVLNLFETLEKICDESSVSYEKWTVSEVLSYIEKIDPTLNSVFQRETIVERACSIVEQEIQVVGNKRLQEMGVIESGLYDYYARRLEKGSIIAKDDAFIIEYIFKNYDKESRILEIAAGCGQVSFALERCGFRKIDFSEFDRKRVAFGNAIKLELDSQVKIFITDYRELELQVYDVVFVMNAESSSLGVQDYQILSTTIKSGTDVILRYGKYGKDNKIFDKLDSDEEIGFEEIINNLKDSEKRGRGIIRYYSRTKEGLK